MNKNIKRIIFTWILVISSIDQSFAINFKDFNSSLMLSVTKSDGKSYICSSVAVSRNKLLTAAHCLDHALEVRVIKEYKLMSKNTFYKVSSYSILKEYNKSKSNFLNDVGIIKLDRSLPTDIIFPELKTLTDNSNDLIRVGFGQRNEINSRTIIFPINQYSVKQHYIDSYDQFSFTGDSGGPIYQKIGDKLYLVAIHSTKEGYTTLNPLLSEEIITWLESF